MSNVFNHSGTRDEWEWVLGTENDGGVKVSWAVPGALAIWSDWNSLVTTVSTDPTLARRQGRVQKAQGAHPWGRRFPRNLSFYFVRVGNELGRHLPIFIIDDSQPRTSEWIVRSEIQVSERTFVYFFIYSQTGLEVPWLRPDGS